MKQCVEDDIVMEIMSKIIVFVMGNKMISAVSGRQVASFRVEVEKFSLCVSILGEMEEI